MDKMIEYPKEGILSKDLANTPKRVLTLFCMAKGSRLSEHTSSKEGIVLVLEGEGVFTLEGKKIKMLPNTLILMEKNAKHSLSAKKNTSFLLSLNE